MRPSQRRPKWQTKTITTGSQGLRGTLQRMRVQKRSRQVRNCLFPEFQGLMVPPRHFVGDVCKSTNTFVLAGRGFAPCNVQKRHAGNAKAAMISRGPRRRCVLGPDTCTGPWACSVLLLLHCLPPQKYVCLGHASIPYCTLRAADPDAHLQTALAWTIEG